MIKLPELSSTHNVVTESAYDILSSNIDNLYTTLGTVTDYVSAAQQQGEIAAISAANVAVSSMGVVGSHLDTILSTENTIKEISSDLANSLDIVSEADNRFTKLELVYEPSGVNCIRGFENLTFDKIISYPESATDPSPITAFEDGNYYKGGYFRFVSGKYNIISSLSINNFNDTDDIAPVDLASTYITIDNTTTNLTMYMGQTGCPVDANANGQMVLSLYVKGSGNLILNLGSGDTTKAINTDTWQRISVYRGGLANSKYITGAVHFSVKPNSTISICAPQFEKGAGPTVYNPNCSYKLLKPESINIANANIDNANIDNINVDKLTINKQFQYLNTADTSQYPLTYIENNYVKPCCRLVGVNGNNSFYYNCDQYYHYFTNQKTTYVYNDKCIFEGLLSGDVQQDRWSHDPHQCWAKYATNDNKKTLVIPWYGNSNDSRYCIKDLTNNTTIANVIIPGSKSCGENGYYIGNPNNAGYVTVNELTQHFIVFCALNTVNYTYNDDGTFESSAAVFVKNGYLIFNDEGYFTKYDYEVSDWKYSAEFDIEFFNEVSTAVSSTWSIDPIYKLCFFRNTSRKRSPPANERVTWFAHTTKTSADNGVWAFDEYDGLIPVLGQTNLTNGRYNPETGIIPMHNNVSSYKLTSPYTKTVACANKPFFIHADTQPDTVGVNTTTCARLVGGRYSYRLFKNPTTGVVSSDVGFFSDGAYAAHASTNAASITFQNNACIMTADGGSYGGCGTAAIIKGDYFTPINNAQLNIPIKLSNCSRVYQNSAGIRSVRMPDAQHFNFNNANSYAAIWRGAFITTF